MLDATTQSALHFTPWHTCSFWKELSCAAITSWNLFTDIFTAVCSQTLIYTAVWTGALWRERKCKRVETEAKVILTRTPSIESRAFYRWSIAIFMRTYLSWFLRLLAIVSWLFLADVLFFAVRCRFVVDTCVMYKCWLNKQYSRSVIVVWHWLQTLCCC